MSELNNLSPPLLFQDHIGICFTSILTDCFKNPSYREFVDGSPSMHNVDLITLEKEIDWDLTYEKCDYLPKGFNELTEDEKFNWAMEEDIDVVYTPVRDHWVVSHWLAEQLYGKGEIVVHFFGYNIWGRQSELTVQEDDILKEIIQGFDSMLPIPIDRSLLLKSPDDIQLVAP